jgi:hypothetical protein
VDTVVWTSWTEREKAEGKMVRFYMRPARLLRFRNMDTRISDALCRFQEVLVCKSSMISADVRTLMVLFEMRSSWLSKDWSPGQDTNTNRKTPNLLPLVSNSSGTSMISCGEVRMERTGYLPR